MRRLSLCLLLLASAVMAADAPKVVIAAPDRAQLGDLVVLDASQSTASDYVWTLVESSKTFLPVDNGRRCIFASGTPGKYTFVLSGAGGDRVAVDVHTIIVDGPSPPPDPAPGPNPPPTPPDFPPGKFGLARQSFDWAGDLSLAAADRSPSAKSLAGSFRATAAAIAAGTLTLPKDILSQTKSSNNEALGGHAEAWKPWGNRLADRLQSLHDASQLRSPDDYQTAWKEIADGLDRVANQGASK